MPNILLGLAGGTEGSPIGTDGSQIGGEGRSSQKAAVDNGDFVILVATRNGELLLGGWDYTNQNHAVAEANPINLFVDSVAHAEVAASGADGTYNYEVTMTGYKWLTIQMELGNGSGTVTAKVYGKVHDSATYEDISELFGNEAKASWTGADGLVLLMDTFCAGRFYKVKIEIVGSGLSADGTWKIYSKKFPL